MTREPQIQAEQVIEIITKHIEGIWINSLETNDNFSEEQAGYSVICKPVLYSIQF